MDHATPLSENHKPTIVRTCVASRKPIRIIIGLLAANTGLCYINESVAQPPQSKISRSIVVAVPLEEWIDSAPDHRNIPKTIASSSANSKGAAPIISQAPSRLQSAATYLPAMKPIGSINVNIASKSRGNVHDLPENQAANALGGIPTIYPIISSPDASVQKIASRSASEVAYKPLYFEEVNLERYGRAYGIGHHSFEAPVSPGPVISGARFFATIPLLPYSLAATPSKQTYYWKWPFEAGRVAPQVREVPPIQAKGVVSMGVAAAGMAVLIP